MTQEGPIFSCAGNDNAGAQSPIPLRGTICENLRAAKRLGYDALEIHARETIPENLEEILHCKRELGMEISALVTGRLCTEGGKSLTSPDAENRRTALDGMRQYIRFAEALQTDLIIGWLRGSCASGQGMADYQQTLASMLLPLEELAAKSGVRLLIEAINRYEINTMRTAEEILAFLDRFGLQNTYVHLDSFHMNIEEADPAQAIRACGARLGYYHAADNTRRYPGCGSIDFDAQMRALAEIGYRGCISLECLPLPSGEEAAQRGLAALRSSAARAGLI